MTVPPPLEAVRAQYEALPYPPRDPRDEAIRLITGTPSPEVLRLGQELGLNNLVRKPFTSVTLKSSIERVVGKL